MGLEERIQEAIKKSEETLKGNPDFIKLQEFYIEMQEAGIAKKQEYKLPQLDTAGRRLHEIVASKSKEKTSFSSVIRRS